MMLSSAPRHLLLVAALAFGFLLSQNATGWAATCQASTAVGSTFGGRVVTDGFGARGDYGVGNSTFHKGIDLRVRDNPSVGAYSGGTVNVYNGGGYGNYVTVTNGSFRTLYAHAGNISVANGQTVTTGQTLGDWSSCSGTCTGAHLHLEYQVKDTNGEWVKVDPIGAQALLDSGMDPSSAEFAAAAIQQTTDGCNVSASALAAHNNGYSSSAAMCDPTIKARVAEQVQMSATQKTDFLATMATMPRPVTEVANTPCMSNELQRIANQFAYAPTMYAANILGQLNGLAGPVSGLMNNMFGSLFKSVTAAANLNPLAQQFNSFASNTLGSLLSSLGLGGPFASQLCGMMVDMVLKYVQCAAPIKLPDLGNLTGSLNNLLGNGCVGAALTSTLYSSAAQSAMQKLAQPVTVQVDGLFSSKPPSLGVSDAQAETD